MNKTFLRSRICCVIKHPPHTRKHEMRNNEPAEAEAVIDMTPMIDMVFILLIFFMVTATFVKDMKLELERPKASSSVVASSKAIRLFIESERVDLCICGHIHEAFGAERSNDTLVVNSGAFKKGSYALIEIQSDGRISCRMEKLDGG